MSPMKKTASKKTCKTCGKKMNAKGTCSSCEKKGKKY